MKIARYYIAALSVIAAVSVRVVLATNMPEAPSPPEAPPATEVPLLPPEAPPGARVIPNCEAKGTIDQTSVGCPTDGSQTVVCNFELKDALGNPTKNFGLDNEDCCTCNAEKQLTECDPNIDPPFPGACPVVPVVTECDPDLGCPVGVVVEPTSIIEAVRDPTCIYKTILGERTLFCEDVFRAPPDRARVAGCTIVMRFGRRDLLCPRPQ